jgi:hypothetical protein
LSPQARKSSSRRRSSQKKDEEPQVDRQGSKTDDDSQQGDQTTETASSSPPVEKTKPEDGDEQPTEQSTLPVPAVASDAAERRAGSAGCRRGAAG